MMPDTRETLDPAWEALNRARMERVWTLRYYQFFDPASAPVAQSALNAWDATHADDWNRLKPWYARRLTGAESLYKYAEAPQEKPRP